jgi:hypothetical protein
MDPGCDTSRVMDGRGTAPEQGVTSDERGDRDRRDPDEHQHAPGRRRSAAAHDHGPETVGIAVVRRL